MAALLADEAPSSGPLLLLLLPPETAVGSEGIDEVFVSGAAVSETCAGVPERDADR